MWSPKTVPNLKTASGKWPKKGRAAQQGVAIVHTMGGNHFPRQRSHLPRTAHEFHFGTISVRLLGEIHHPAGVCVCACVLGGEKNAETETKRQKTK